MFHASSGRILNFVFVNEGIKIQKGLDFLVNFNSYLMLLLVFFFFTYIHCQEYSANQCATQSDKASSCNLMRTLRY